MGDVLDGVIKVLAALTVIYPPLSRWLSEVTKDRTDEISLRVSEILPERSKSAEAVSKLGWR